MGALARWVTLSLQYLTPSSTKNDQYLNWDRATDKGRILSDQIPLTAKRIAFDEIHKYKYWRNLVKGIYDKYHEDHEIIVTGSARLDYFRKGGESLMGRYRYFRLHRYLRDTDGREIDFVVLKDKKPIFAVECKTGDKQLSPHIEYFRHRTKIPLFYQVHTQTKDYCTPTSGRVLPFTTFCRELG